MPSKSQIRICLTLLTICLVVVACKGDVRTPIVLPPTPSNTQISPTSSPVPPSPTPVALAATVNGEGITLAEYQEELARYKSAQGITGAQQGEKLVLEELIDQALLAQSAYKTGFTLDDVSLQNRIEALTKSLGNAKVLADWITAHGYTEESFKQALRRDAASAWMRDNIASQVPQVAEQIHARQILLYNSEQADQVLAQIQAGTDFASLALKYDPVRGGDLGWFPRGYLTTPEIEEAVFPLKEGKITEVIKTRLGYHILQVIQRDPQRPLDPDARRKLQSQALRNWLEKQRSQSTIQVLLP